MKKRLLTIFLIFFLFAIFASAEDIEVTVNGETYTITPEYYSGPTDNPELCGFEFEGELIEINKGETKRLNDKVKATLMSITPEEGGLRCQVSMDPVECFDSDGFTNLSGEVSYDYCDRSENLKQLVEYSCSEDDTVAESLYDCSVYCDKGACVEKISFFNRIIIWFKGLF